MGALFSALCPPHRGNIVALDAIEPRLETGDVMLFSVGGSDNYLAKLGSRHPSSQSGFLIRERQGVEGLQLCHCSTQKGPQSGITHLTSLSQFFAESPFDTVIIRKLCVPLSEEQQERVRRFAQENQESVFTRKVTVMMKRTDRAWLFGSLYCLRWSKRSVERFICSELIAKMLLSLELIRGNEREYVPVASERRVADSMLFQSSIIVKS